MRVLLNGEPYETAARFISELIAEQVPTVRVAAVVNDRVVPAAEQAVTLLAEGDRVELLTFAGGG
ncbi:MAG TPA: sulfur carrier protein ThiS [Kiritimatiellia bacterium]|jgi:sulfur carrier protein|nr:sulfur carrier protein ThiS [Kiritimatiellia bacterium]